MENDAIRNLRSALDISPENVPLRLHLAQVLKNENKLEEAESEYKTILNYAPTNQDAKCGLAEVCYLQKKWSLAFVILEEICKNEQIHPRFNVMFAKILLRDGMKEEAGIEYRKAVEKDRSINDKELDSQFRLPEIEIEFDEEFLDEEDGFFEDKLQIEKPSTRFDDIGGMDKVKEEIRMKIIHPLTHPELYKAYGKKTGGGILLYGPPGCGKTHIARATAGEVNAKFISVGIKDILDMWIGSSEKNLNEIFELARRNAPCVLFFDEVDALGANRSDMKNSAGRHLINQFLSEMDGMDASNEGILILAATNAPWHLDPAFRRPGRFDRIMFVPPPDDKAREEILKIELKDKPQQNISISDIAQKTKDYSGADIKALIDVVIESKLRESLKSGLPQPITTKDLLQHVAQVKPSTKEWFTIARNYALYANESGQYDDILAYLNIKK